MLKSIKLTVPIVPILVGQHCKDVVENSDIPAKTIRKICCQINTEYCSNNLTNLKDGINGTQLCDGFLPKENFQKDVVIDQLCPVFMKV